MSVPQGALVHDRYRIGATLGVGGMGTVYSAHDEALSRSVAIKMLHPEIAARPDARSRFAREAKVAAAFSHPNAIRIFDFGEDGGRPFIAMEMLRGVDLAQKISQEGRLSVATAVELGYDVADVLHAAHSRDLIHRDIKPDNIFIDETKRVVVLDFGMAFMRETDDPEVGRLTREGLSGGTPAYMAPEQCSGMESSGVTDVYALGCVLFEALIGAPPFSEEVTTNYLIRHLYDTAERLTVLRSDVPKALDELVARMLSKQPDDRPTALAVRRRLARLDVATLGVRERSRDASYLSDRNERALPRPTPALPMATPEGPEMQEALSLLISSEPNDRLRLGLATVGVAADFGPTSSACKHDAVYLPSGDLETVAHAVADAAGKPVLVGVENADIDQIKALLRLGVKDVITRPDSAAQLAAKLRRLKLKGQRP